MRKINTISFYELIALGTMLLLVISLSSCRTVNKHRSKTETTFDSTGMLKKDSSFTASIDTGSEKSSLESKEEGAEIYFNDSDTCTDVEPVKIEQKNGVTTIDPGKRKIKSIKTTAKNLKVVSDSSGKKEKSAGNLSTNQNTTVSKTTKNIEVSKKSSSFNWWWLLLLIPIIGVYYYFGRRFEFITGIFKRKNRSDETKGI